MIELPDDFRDLLIALHDAGAEFVILGGYAVAFHGHPRATKDLDVLVRADALLRNKRAAGREQDLADVTALEALRKQR